MLFTQANFLALIVSAEGTPYRFGGIDPFNGGADCLVAGTLVATEHGEIPIENIHVGERVHTRQGLQRVTQAWLVREDAETVEAPLSNGRTLRGTADHRVFTQQKGWVKLRNLCASDRLISSSATSAAPHSPASQCPIARTDTAHDAVTTSLRIVGRPTVVGRSAVYDLTVENAHEFFAEGALVHNCSGLIYWAGLRCGVSLPRTTTAEWAALPHSTNLAAMPYAACVEFEVPSDGGSPPQHVGINIGNGFMIDDPETGEVVSVQVIPDNNVVWPIGWVQLPFVDAPAPTPPKPPTPQPSEEDMMNAVVAPNGNIYVYAADPHGHLLEFERTPGNDGFNNVTDVTDGIGLTANDGGPFLVQP